ncbi:MAG: hypothetical protein JRH10_13555 [Deltaproteobacteria bacterium]|nr:hypothetical protein [Deltaproteobacteria bacterium]MBW2448385.1 hypothetical protein [Deltaproteobacteria bacterium]
MFGTNPGEWRRALGALALALAACGPPPPPPVAPTPPESVPGPLRLLSHADPPTDLLVFDNRQSRGLVASLGPVLDAVNRARDPADARVALTILQWRRDRGAARVEASATPIERIEVESRFDVWLQDVAEAAFAPRAGGDLGLVLVAPSRGHGLERFAPELALRWGARWVRLPRSAPGAASGGGNVEVLPSDLLLLGSTVGDSMSSFLLDRGYRTHHVLLDTSWLRVGHVDEILSHVVTGAGPCDFSLVRAAPALAVELARADPDPPRWLRRKSETFIRQQLVLDARIAAAASEVSHALLGGGCSSVPVLRVPVLFRCEGDAESPARCTSERPNSVNMTVLDRHLLVPDPRYAPFAQAARRALEAHGQVVHLLDADSQHDREGGIHCATAVRRVPRGQGPRPAPQESESAIPARTIR